MPSPDFAGGARGEWRELARFAWPDMQRALGFLTILPVGNPDGPLVLPAGQVAPPLRKPGHAFAWFPLVGLALGAVLALVGWLLANAPLLRAAGVLGTWVVLTGALHLDGFGDACDGLLATTTPQRRLEIMKDPRAGSWAVVGVTLLLITKFAAVASLPPELIVPALLVAPVAGRWAMTAAARAFPYARSSGMGGYFRDGLGRPQVVVATVGVLLIVAALFWFAPLLLATVIAAPVAAYGGGRWAAARLEGGLTGDVYGAICEATEVLCLLILALPAAL